MKTVLFTLAAIAVIVPQATHSADVECGDALTNALNVPEASTCKTESGLDFTNAMPTADVVNKVCASSACQTLVRSIAALNLDGECVIGGMELHEILDPIFETCMTSLESSGSEDSTDEITAGSTQGSHASMSHDAGNTTMADDDDDSHDETNATPTPTDSGAASVAIASSAVLFAAVTSLL